MVDVDVELKKIEIVKDSVHMYFNLGNSIVSGSLVALIVLLITLFFSGSLGTGLLGLSVSMVLIIALAIVYIVVFGFLNRQNNRFLKLADEWMKRIERGETLSIAAMQKQLNNRQ